MFSKRNQQEQTGMRDRVLIQQMCCSWLMGSDILHSSAEAEFFLVKLWMQGSKSFPMSPQRICMTSPLTSLSYGKNEGESISQRETKCRLSDCLVGCAAQIFVCSGS